MAPEGLFVSLPVLGGMAYETNMNVGLGNFLYESKSHPGSLTTFMSSDVDAKEFVDALPSVSEMNMNMDVDLLAFGFGRERWSAWIDCSVKSRNGISIPKEMFSFMKYSLSIGKYDIRDIKIESVNYIETALGFQIKPLKNLSTGVSLKILDGLAYAKAGVDNIDVSTFGDKWLLQANASVQSSIPGLMMEMEDNKISGIATGMV